MFVSFVAVDVMLRADFIISAKLWLLFPKIKIFSSAEHSDEHMKHL